MSSATSRVSTAPSSPDLRAMDSGFSNLNFNIASGATTPERPSSPINFPSSPLPSGKHRIAVIGSGSWGTALAKIAAENALRHPSRFHSEVRLWVRQKQVNGKKLTDVINKTHMNSNYLPGVLLPENLVATPKLSDVVKDATIIIMVTPHQFLHTVISELTRIPGTIHPGARVVSAIKGVEVEGTNISTFASLIEKELGTPCSALSGANIALEVAQGQFCETTIGCPSSDDAKLWHAVFDAPTFRVNTVEDVNGVSLSGALKNVVALAAGMVDGLRLGGNTKAAILRIGLQEMTNFTLEFFDGVQAATFSNESAGIADLITTCYGGRNRKCAEEFVKTGHSFEVIERRLLNGQKLQGTATAEEVNRFLTARGCADKYPLFEKVFKISFEGMPPSQLVKGL
ncbi:hypothetical protein CcaverHIS641_0402910 [Cutaneotrichosporon cavernicola]|nr:hypothetical protein CcaverHIS641_0402910 [Cutaneotrichosporon cavernicola]